ncbi:tRNA uridine(34) 5-carboxymethylaminomethyl modification radical SAM/GNAT enzyme Elp3 [Candidatus Woesearchaeota archaeon]|nr:MAG: tRNA uridine(34) 5-carboxymethylaminomethyl modification radical SAM/GNAT enzyme Elp3 [Candidatus Woesearchaeota archaeon]
MEEFYKELKRKSKNLNKKELNKLKIELCKKYKLNKVPPNYDLVLHGIKIKTKPMRTQSGVSVIALMTKPSRCPHGKCIYCPGGVKSSFGDVPQSYTGHEPSALRGKRHNYDPYLMTFNRLEQYIVNGHIPEKTEVIIQGGTFPAFPQEYKENFIMYTFKALNDFGKIFFSGNKPNIKKFKEFFELPGEIGDKKRQENIRKKILKLKGKSTLKKEQEKNEKAKIKCVALCIETRPDYCKQEHINEMLNFGCTRVELGVQSLNDKVLDFVKRGHTVQEVKEATELLKNSIIKFGYHMMPGLPLTSPKEDIKMFKELFTKEEYMPDNLKIYPCLLFKGTELYNLYKQGKFKPLNEKEATELIIEAKKHVPKWCRIMRIQRDIPEKYIDAGIKKTNLREVVHKKMQEKEIKCKCIRCREPRNKQISWKHVKLKRTDYKSSNGNEIFLSFEDTKNDLLLGFCRLRIMPKSNRQEINKGDAGIRELHVYGAQALTGEKGEVQHRGLGKRLVKEAERIAKEEFRCKKILVISGIGVKEYYKKLGYAKDGVYMSKKL